MNLEWMIRPFPLVIPAITLLMYLQRSWAARRWPEVDKCIEIIAYGSGLYAACILVPKAFMMDDPSQGMRLALFTGAVVTGIASARGAWVVLSAVNSQAEPQADNATHAKTTGPNTK